MYSIRKTPTLSNTSIKTLFVLILGVVFFVNTSYAQKNVRDSLVQLLQTEHSTIHFSEKDTIHINLLNKLANNLLYYKADSLLKVSKQALDLSKGIDYKKGHIEALSNIGNYYTLKGDYENAIENFETVQRIVEEEKITNYIIENQKNLGIAYFYTNNYAEALKQFLKGIEIATKEDNKPMLSSINENLGIMYAAQDNYQQAFTYFEIANKINEEIGDETSIASTGAYIAKNYAEIGKHEYALEHINNSIKVFEKHKLMDWLAYSYQVKGDIFLKNKNYKWAISWYNQSQSLHDKSVEGEKMEIPLLNGLAEANLGLKKTYVSKKSALKALEIASRLNDIEGIEKSSEILYKISKRNNDVVSALKYHEIYKKISDSIIKNGNQKNLLMLQTKINHEQQKQSLIDENKKAMAKQYIYIYITLAIVLILIIITLLIKRSAKMQKDLNKELNTVNQELNTKKTDLENNEVKLKNINETKDKMFSIIGHDLRGPIGALQDLLDLFKNGEINQNEFLKLVPKLRTDIGNISFTLNNLLSWGRTQMNGTTTTPTVVSLIDLAKDNINFLSQIADRKSIKMINKIDENTLIWSDENQINLVIRNLMSNALKFTPKNGTITIKAREMNKHWEVSINDTGVGIKKETLDNMFLKNTNVTTYGTDNEKGTGLGLVLCKEMVENNKGEIRVESTLNVGTSFYFTVPKPEKTYQKAG